MALFNWGRSLFRGKEPPEPPPVESRAEPTAFPAPPVKWYHAAVAGESHRNADGTDRQRIIRDRVKPGDSVQFIPEPENPYDKNAVKVCLSSGEQIGYIPRERAAEFLREQRGGWRHLAIIHRIAGGTRTKPTRGVVLRVVSAPPGAAERDIITAMYEARTAED